MCVIFQQERLSAEKGAPPIPIDQRVIFTTDMAPFFRLSQFFVDGILDAHACLKKGDADTFN